MKCPATRLSLFADPDDQSDQIVLTQLVELEPEAALNYWDELGAEVEGWINSLPKKLKRVAVERISIEVRWVTDGRSA